MDRYALLAQLLYRLITNDIQGFDLAWGYTPWRSAPREDRACIEEHTKPYYKGSQLKVGDFCEVMLTINGLFGRCPGDPRGKWHAIVVSGVGTALASHELSEEEQTALAKRVIAERFVPDVVAALREPIAKQDAVNASALKQLETSLLGRPAVDDEKGPDTDADVETLKALIGGHEQAAAALDRLAQKARRRVAASPKVAKLGGAGKRA